MDTAAEFALPAETFLRSTQKVCDAADWDDPQFRYAVEDMLGEKLWPRRKQWDFGMILVTLARAGKLNPASYGISFGAGRERILYAISRYVGRIHATDLYTADTRWKTARVSSADIREQVIEASPMVINPDKIEVTSMDMCAITAKDKTYDFAYSACVLEHIGDRTDFVSHFREVKRTLKDEGVYAFTTEHSLMGKTIEHRGCYRFTPEFLIDCIHEAGLECEPEFDASLTEHDYNQPMQPVFCLPDEYRSGKHPKVILTQQGLVFTTCCFVVRKPTGPPATVLVKGYDQAKNMVDARWRGRLIASFQEGCAVPVQEVKGGYSSAWLWLGNEGVSVTCGSVGGHDGATGVNIFKRRIIRHETGESKVKIGHLMPAAQREKSFLPEDDCVYQFCFPGKTANTVADLPPLSIRLSS